MEKSLKNITLKSESADCGFSEKLKAPTVSRLRKNLTYEFICSVLLQCVGAKQIFEMPDGKIYELTVKEIK